MSLIGRQFHLGDINTKASRLGSRMACSAGVISLASSTIGSPACFHYSENYREKNKQGEINENVWRKRKKPKGVLQGVRAVRLLRLVEQCFNRKCVK